VIHTLYTIGYLGRTVGEIEDMMFSLNAYLVDIRYRTRSRIRHWNGNALKEYFETRYWPLSALGNVNYKNGGPVQLANPEIGLSAIRLGLSKAPLILLCACRDWRTCHRRHAAEFIQEHLGCEVVHL
jgi:uncharacterized protein (DUF488 family)